MTERRFPRTEPFLGDTEPCVYLPAERARMRYRVIPHCPPELYESLLVRGWRRFGTVFFRPACAGCSECVSLRVDVKDFRLRRSMRRTRDRNQDLRVVTGPPSLSDAHLDLYHRYHQDMTERRQWDERQTDPADYYQTFVESPGDFAREMLYFRGDTLVAVALVDVLPSAMSSIYCYYDPDERHRSLGKFSILQQLAWAKRRGIPYLYLGYRVWGNRSMRYKARYRPHQVLEGRPLMEEPPRWRTGTSKPPQEDTESQESNS